MKVSSSHIYRRDIRNLEAWVEYLSIQTKFNYKGTNLMENDEMDFDSLFTFGKYKDEMLEDVIDNDPSYIAWLVENDVVLLSPDIMNHLGREKII